MADTYTRSADVPVGSGYRELPEGGATWGPDLKTIVYAGVGVFFGILAGTAIADGSWRSLNFMSQRHTAQVSSIPSAPANVEVAKSVQTPPPQAQTLKQGTPQPAADLQPTVAPQTAAAQSAVVQSTVAQRDSAAQSTTAQSIVASRAGAAQPTTVQSTIDPPVSVTHKMYVTQQASGIQRTYAAHRHRLVHRFGGHRRHIGRRRVHIRHRLRAALKSAADAKPPSTALALKSSDAVAPVARIPSAFTIHGEVTVFNYDSAAGIIQTNEGETFALDKAQGASATATRDDYGPNIHYQCDQLWNCTLNRGGGVVINAKRTR